MERFQELNSYAVWFIPCLVLLVPLANVEASIGPNGTLESEVRGIQQAINNNKLVSTLDSIEAIINDSQNSGVLGRMAKCGASMQNMTEEQHQCVNDMAMGLEGLK